jgi:hypothetical protein
MDTTSPMINTSNRLRALALLVVTFAAGGVGGVAADRVWTRTHDEKRVEARPPGWRGSTEGVESDRIPYPLELLQPSPQEEARLHEIARRWRPQAAQAMEGIRANISELENNMFAEMLCVISRDKQERYLAQLQENGANRVLIAKRFALVRSNRCEEVRR